MLLAALMKAQPDFPRIHLGRRKLFQEYQNLRDFLMPKCIHFQHKNAQTDLSLCPIPQAVEQILVSWLSSRKSVVSMKQIPVGYMSGPLIEESLEEYEECHRRSVALPAAASPSGIAL